MYAWEVLLCEVEETNRLRTRSNAVIDGGIVPRYVLARSEFSGLWVLRFWAANFIISGGRRHLIASFFVYWKDRAASTTASRDQSRFRRKAGVNR